MGLCSMGFWELTRWEIVIFAIIFGVVLYLIIKAPSSSDLTKKHTSCKSTSIEDSFDKSTLPDKSKE